MKTRCGGWLWNLGSSRPGTVQSCLCCNECPWVWQLRERGRWSHLAFWRTTAPEISGGLWVRLPEERSRQIRLAEERAW